MPERSQLAEVRNPLLSLPAMRRLQAFPKPVREAIAEVLRDIRRDALQRAENCWRKHKAPMAAYWKTVGVYAGHAARALR